jgi:hypothetical protein
MKYDGVVVRNKKSNLLFLFILDPDTNELRDGFNISEHECYKDLNNDQLMVVNVTFRDGTQEIDKIDLEEFIHGDSYGKYDTFIHIQDLLAFSILKNKDDKAIPLDKIIKNGDLTYVAIECIEETKKQMVQDE